MIGPKTGYKSHTLMTEYRSGIILLNAVFGPYLSKQKKCINCNISKAHLAVNSFH